MRLKYPLSFTSVSLYHQCPFKWHKQYVEKIKQPPTMILTFGIAFHKILEIMFLTGNFDYEDLLIKWSEVYEKTVRGFAFRMDAGEKYQYDYFYTLGRTFLNRSLKLFRDWDLLKKVSTDLIERDLRTKFRDFKIRGKPDIMIPIPKDELFLIDYKTSKEEKDEHHIQIAIYKEVARAKGYNVTEAGIIYPKLKKISPLKCDRKKAGHYVNDALQGIRADQFEPKENEYCKYCHVRLKQLCPLKTYRPIKKKADGERKTKSIKYTL